MRIEPGVGGRWLEVWDAISGEGFEIGRVLVWEPGVRLVFSHRTMPVPEPVTQVEVVFQVIEAGTRVTLTHRRWQGVPAGPGRTAFERMQVGWSYMLGWLRGFAVLRGEGQCSAYAK